MGMEWKQRLFVFDRRGSKLRTEMIVQNGARKTAGRADRKPIIGINPSPTGSYPADLVSRLDSVTNRATSFRGPHSRR